MMQIRARKTREIEKTDLWRIAWDYLLGYNRAT